MIIVGFGLEILIIGKNTAVKREKSKIVRPDIQRRENYISVGEGLVDNTTNTGIGRVMLTSIKPARLVQLAVIAKTNITVANDGRTVQRIRMIT